MLISGASTPADACSGASQGRAAPDRPERAILSGRLAADPR
jgi:hypothetical protein